jgi:uncharacterized protein YkwD
MRRSLFFLLPFMSACMAGVSPTVLSNGSETTASLGTGLPGSGGSGLVEVNEGFSLLLNDERSASGVIELTQDSRLTAAAEAHAADMVDNDYLSHTDLNGGGPGDRATAAGYDWNFIAENIAQGFYSNAAVIDAWMNSSGHRANMLDERAEDFGIARVDSTWVLMLGREFD